MCLCQSIQALELVDLRISMAVELNNGLSVALPSPSSTSSGGESSLTFSVYAVKLPKPLGTGNASNDAKLAAHWRNAQKVITSMMNAWELGTELWNQLEIGNEFEQ